MALSKNNAILAAFKKFTIYPRFMPLLQNFKANVILIPESRDFSWTPLLGLFAYRYNEKGNLLTTLGG